MIVTDIFRKLRNYATGLNAMQSRLDILQTKLDEITASLETVKEIERIAKTLPSAELLAKLLGKSDSLLTSQLELLYSAYLIEARMKIKMGLSGQLKLTPQALWLRISENCNLKCVGCHEVGKFKKKYMSIEDVKKAIKFDGHVNEINLTSFESLLHPQFCEIIELCRETHPESKIWVITNGTIPIKGRYKKAISMLNKVGLSIDGASKAVFESIRIGAVYEEFIENTKAIVEIRKQTGSPQELTFAFTATSTNLHELGEVVKLAHSLGVPEVWAQAMEAKDEVLSERVYEILIDRLDPESRASYINAAKEEAKRLGVKLYCSEGIYPIKSGITEINGDSRDVVVAKREPESGLHLDLSSEPIPHVPIVSESKPDIKSDSDYKCEPDVVSILNPRNDSSINNELYVKLCQFPWQQPAQVSEIKDGYLILPCCYMGYMDIDDVKYGLKLTKIKPMDEIYNSTAFWRFREDLMEGRTTDVCGNCQAARGYTWKPSTECDTKDGIN